MKTLFRFLLVFIMTMGMVSTVSAAQGSDGKPANYFAIKGGIYSPSEDFDLTNVNAGQLTHLSSTSRFAGELALGHYFLPYLAVEMGAGYFDRKASDDTRLRVVPAVVTGKLLLPIGIFEPYGEFGMGAYFSTLDIENSDDSTKVTYGLHAGAGFNINFTDTFFLGAEGRYLWTEPDWGGQDVRLDGFITTGNLGFRF